MDSPSPLPRGLAGAGARAGLGLGVGLAGADREPGRAGRGRSGGRRAGVSPGLLSLVRPSDVVSRAAGLSGKVKVFSNNGL
jgi:hypothetical protein